MSYQDIIIANEKVSPVAWWPHYAYHFTDVQNAVSILETETLYSRLNAEDLHIMKNDNASRQVIDMTVSAATSYVRMYFRPLTPTQYYNEGFKLHQLRYEGDPNANVPVPVFFFFHLDKLLADPSVLFSEGSEAGHGVPAMRGETAFAKLDFQKIYRNGPYVSQTEEDRKKEGSYRQSEILIHDRYQIQNSLAGIVCRNDIERQTLLNLLSDQSNLLFRRWAPHIKVIKQDVFYDNGLAVEDCLYDGNGFSIVFSDSFQRIKFLKGRSCTETVNVSVRFIWLHGKKSLYETEFTFNLDYLNPQSVPFSGAPYIKNAQEIAVVIRFDGCLMCYKKFSLLSNGY